MKLIFTECSKLKDSYDVHVKRRFVRSQVETASGKPPKVEFNWPDFTIESEDGDFIAISYSTLIKIKNALGAKYLTISG